jgi:hypothetical protein
MQSLSIVNVFEEGADRLPRLVEITIIPPVYLPGLSVFMKLSALALS